MKLRDSSLLTISLVIACCGLLGLFFSAQLTSLPSLEMPADFIDKGSYYLNGSISSVRSSEKVTSFILHHDCTLPVVVFSSLVLENGDIVLLEGEWNGEDFIAEEVSVVDEMYIS